MLISVSFWQSPCRAERLPSFPRHLADEVLLQDANSSGKSSATSNYTLKCSCLSRLMMGFALGFHGLSIK